MSILLSMSARTVHTLLAPVLMITIALSFGLYVNTTVTTFTEPPSGASVATNVERRDQVLGESEAVVEEHQVVKRVIDGDTIKLANGDVVRYIGVDSPEVRKNECYAGEATEFNRGLVEGRMVKLVKDVSDTDTYGRKLRYVYVGSVFVNDHLVTEGYAVSKSYPPDIDRQEQLDLSERDAQASLKGLWSKCQG